MLKPPRILITMIAALAIVFVTVNRIAPAAYSFYTAQKAPAVVRIVPVDLSDKSVSKSAGTKLSYFGYEFEVPWSDLDETKSRLYPKDDPKKTKVDLRFRSGLRLLVSARSPREWINDLPADIQVSAQDLESSSGPEVMKSDYRLVKTLYEFTPDNMDHWIVSRGANNRDAQLLAVKSNMLPKSAETGIFNLHNLNFIGFQQGNPRVRQDEIAIDLYSDEGSIEMTFFQSDYHNFAGVTQAEINCIVQSLHKTTQNDSTTSNIAQGDDKIINARN